MLAASNTSVRNSTTPLIPAGPPVSVKDSANENTKSIRAVWVRTGNELTCTSPNLNPPAKSAPPAKFCQATNT
ncbi:hypothetical protein LAUMK7_05739 [Mycobacterium kansasii]|nr:hypothetical protein LAUMK40_05880 [Mycobacterium kansasii]VAZ81188.1 hypothetical protein LAUMK7_05739 [Mycobacterium kansasii]